jgi:putative membrane protein
VNLIVRLTSGALAFWAATSLLNGISVNGGAWSYLWVALLLILHFDKAITKGKAKP